MSLFYWQAFILALSELTIIPGTRRFLPAEIHSGLRSYAILMYPLVGAVLAALLLLMHFFLPEKLGVTAQTLLLIVVWVMVAGGRHLQGFIQAIDEYRLKRVTDQALVSVTPPGAIGLVLLILVKMALLRTAIEIDIYLMAIPASLILARLLAVIFRLMFAPENPDNVHEAPVQVPQYWLIVMTLLILMALTFGLGYLPAIGLILLLAAWLIYWQHYWHTWMGRYTESAMGALIEVAEVLVLLAVVLAA